MIRKHIEKVLFKFATNEMRISLARRWGVRIGKDCRIYDCDFGSEPYLVAIGDHCEITSGVRFITHDGGTWIFRRNNDFVGTKYGPIIVHENSMIGMNSIILPNVEIGPNSVVGAGSIVTKDVKAASVYAGNPARFIYTYDEYLASCERKSTGDIDSKNKKDILLNLFRDRLEKIN